MNDTTETPSGVLADDTRAHNKHLIFDALAAASIQTLTVGFDGYSDSGQIDEIEAWSTSSDTIPLPSSRKLHLVATTPDDPPIEMTLQEAIETLAYDYLEETHYGWENDEGAFGKFVFSVPDRTITLEHNERFTDYQTHNHSF